MDSCVFWNYRKASKYKHCPRSPFQKCAHCSTTKEVKFYFKNCPTDPYAVVDQNDQELSLKIELFWLPQYWSVHSPIDQSTNRTKWPVVSSLTNWLVPTKSFSEIWIPTQGPDFNAKLVQNQVYHFLCAFLCHRLWWGVTSFHNWQPLVSTPSGKISNLHHLANLLDQPRVAKRSRSILNPSFRAPTLNRSNTSGMGCKGSFLLYHLPLTQT